MFFWISFVAAALALGRLWSNAQPGIGQLGRADALAAAVLVLAVIVLGRIMYRLAEPTRR